MTPLSAAAHVFVADLSVPELEEHDRWHLTRVLRLRSGAAVTASDGAGQWRPCRLGGQGLLELEGEVVVEPSPRPEVTVAFALVKGQRPDLVVQKLTELGVDRIVPFVAERSVVRWDGAKVARNLQRFARIAREAGMQCRRARLPAIGLPDRGARTQGDGSGLPRLAEVARLPGAALADLSGEPVAPSVATVLVGPEGGWSETERELRVPRVRLSPHVLRTETAAITAGALLAASRSDITSSSASSQVATQKRDVIV